MHELSASPNRSAERVLTLGAVFLIWAFLISVRLFDLQVLTHARYLHVADAQQYRVLPILPRRGAILDRDRNYLAISSRSRVLAVNPGQIDSKALAAQLLGRILQDNSGKLKEDLEAAAASKRHHGYFVIEQHLSDEKAEELSALRLNWIIIGDGSVRSYPNHQLAAHVIGNVNAEGKGAAGVERKFDRELGGIPGVMRVKVDVRSRPYDSDIVDLPIMGKTVALTIDSDVQHVAEDALKQAVIQNHADHGSVVAMDPNTGEVYALANYPTYDLDERPRQGEKLTGRENLAVGAPFEPGSVFKVVTLSAALETTNLKPDTMINCGSGVMTLFTRVIHDSHPYSVLSMEDVLAKSSNIGAIRIGMQVGNKNLYEYIRRFGFGSRTGIELPAEAPGMLRPLKRWQPTSIGSVPMGHEISVTSLQLAQLGSVIANGGFLIHPHIVAWRLSPGGPREVVKLPAPIQVLQPKTVMTMRMMMRRVVMPGGTAHRLHVTGYTIAGKTGTAQIFDFAHHVYSHRYNASFLGFAPLVNPRMVIVVSISGTSTEAGFGGAAAGPVFQTVMETALRRCNVPRDVPEDIEVLEAKDKQLKNVTESDDTVLAELNPPTPEEQAAAEGTDPAQIGQPDPDPHAPKVPNFVGKTVKDVMQQAAMAGIELDMTGEGLARGQSPRPGALLPPNARIQVRFAR